MAAPFGQVITELGPRDGSAWTPPLGAVQTIPAGDGEYAVFIAPPVTVNTISGRAIQDALPADNVMFNLSQVLITPAANVAGALAVYDVAFNLYRAGAVVGGGKFAGWAAGACPALTAFESLAVPFDISNTELRPLNLDTPVSATQAVLPIQPGDVVTCSVTIGAAPVTYVALDGH